MGYQDQRDIPEQSESKDSPDQDVLIAQLEEIRMDKAKRPKAERGVVFQQPTAAEQAKSYKDDPSRPLVDRFGRQRWISERMCWCSSAPDADECRFHNKEEPGWEECPNKPHTVSLDDYKIKPRHLWHSNPDFDKTPTEEETEILIAGGSIGNRQIEVEVNENISSSGDVQQVVEITG